MPTVFLSYSRADLPLIKQLQARLQASAPDISIWRDQEKIYGGQNWPKVLGEAIAVQDVFLLAWSKNSKSSHFVEFELCTAIALKKAIVPCLLDETPLPPALRTFHGYSTQDVADLTDSLVSAPAADTERRAPVIRKLNDITATDEKTLFAQQQWTVQGNAHQADSDTRIHEAPIQQTQRRRGLRGWGGQHRGHSDDRCVRASDLRQNLATTDAEHGGVSQERPSLSRNDHGTQESRNYRNCAGQFFPNIGPE